MTFGVYHKDTKKKLGEFKCEWTDYVIVLPKLAKFCYEHGVWPSDYYAVLEQE